MSYEEFRHVRACVALMLCASMIFGMFLVGAGYGRAAPDDAVFKGNVMVGGSPAPDTLVMYSIDVDGSPTGNSTVSDMNGDYEIWVEGGMNYYLYFANGAAMFDNDAQLPSYIGVGQTKYVNATLNPAPTRTVTVKGYLTNASNASQPVTGGHVLALRALYGGEPDYINWTKPNTTGYYEAMVLPGMVLAAVFDAPGYFPTMGPSMPAVYAPGDTVWINMSMRPFTGYAVNVSGFVRDSLVPTPIQDAIVTASLDDMGITMSNRTDLLGSYLVQMLEGDGEVRVAADGYVSQRLDYVHFSGNMSVDFYLNKETAEVHGYVINKLTGQPIADSSVRVGCNVGPNLDQFNQTITGPDGFYSMNISGGDWWAEAEAYGYGGRGESFSILSGQSILRNITLEPESGTVKGYVVDSSTSLPIEGASVRINGRTSGQDNATSTDPTGYFSMKCLPDKHQITFIATGYMWEVSSGYSVVVDPDETVWVNITLDPATVELFGIVADAITSVPIDGAEISAASLARDPGYFRIAVTNSVAGNYSVMVAYDEDFTILGAQHPSYVSYNATTSVPDVAVFRHDVLMIPLNAPEFSIFGFVNDSFTNAPIANASVDPYYGALPITMSMTNESGLYGITIPTVEVVLRVYADGYLPKEIVVPSGSPNSTVWVNVTLDAHFEPPLLSATVMPDHDISVFNHANLSANIVEPYLSMVRLNLMKVTNMTADYAWTEVLESFTSQTIFGGFFGDLSATEASPGNWSLTLGDWDATSNDLLLLADGTSSQLLVNSWAENFGRELTIITGAYKNASMTFPHYWSDAVFDSSGAFIGVDLDGGSLPDPGTASDPTGEFWMTVTYVQLNLTDGHIMAVTAGPSTHLEAPSMHIDLPVVVYPSGDYAALWDAVDAASNRNFSTVMFTVDNDPPAADAGTNQTSIVGLMVTLDASASTDNGAVVNYTWSIEDGTALTMYGPLVDYTFATVGNHTVTVTVSDAAGYSTSASTWVNVLADQAPVALAGPDQVVNEDTLVHFNGTGSHDDIGITNYTWTVVGSAVVMYGATPNCTFTTPGMHHVRLVVTDTIGQVSEYDEVVIAASDTTAPVADAGADLMINVGTAASFDGSGSTDNAGVTQYTWTFTDGVPKTLTGQTATYTFNAGGNYTVTLTVRDAEGNSDTDTMFVRVNVAPGADAGTDMTVKSGDVVTFDGSSSTDDYEIQNYTWTFTYQGVSKSMYGATPKFTFEEPGTYTVQLTVKDVGGLTKTDSVTVTVSGASAGASFLNDYWWLLLVIVAVIVVAAVVVLMRRGKGPETIKPDNGGSEVPPPPEDSDELQFPPPDDEEL